MLGFMSVSGVVGWLNIRHLAVELRVPDEIYRDIPTQLVVRISSRRRWLPSFLLQVTVCGETLSVPYLPVGPPQTRQLIHTFDRRGEVAIGPLFVASPFPVNFFCRSGRLQCSASALVFPAPRPIAWADDAARESRRGSLRTQRSGGGGDTIAIGDYTGREPLKQVHWRLSAKHAELKVKHGAQPAGEPLIIDLAALPGNIEEKLGGAAWLVNQASRRGRPVGLRLPDRQLPPACSRQHRLRLLQELARHGQA